MKRRHAALDGTSVAVADLIVKACVSLLRVLSSGALTNALRGVRVARIQRHRVQRGRRRLRHSLPPCVHLLSPLPPPPLSAHGPEAPLALSPALALAIQWQPGTVPCRVMADAHVHSLLGRAWPIALTTGFGAGAAYADCDRSFNPARIAGVRVLKEESK